MKPSSSMVIVIIALLVALSGSAVAALRLPANSVGTRNTPRTLVSSRQPIVAFAQDGGRLAWITRSSGSRGCGSQLRILTLRTGRTVSVSRTGWCNGGSAWGLELGGDRALWITDGDYSNSLAWNSFRTASASDRHATVIDRASFCRNAGEQPGPSIAGGAGSVIFYTEHADDYGECQDQAVKGVVAGKAVSVFTPSGPGRTIGLAKTKDRLALIKYGFDYGAGTELDLTWIELHSSDGSLLLRFQTHGQPRDVALAADLVAVLTASGYKESLRVFDARTGKPRAVVRRTARFIGGILDDIRGIAASGHWVAFSTSTKIFLLDTATKVVTSVTTAKRPLGLSISGQRLAWAEAAAHGSRIRAVTLPR
jgi:hypothetical protein